MHSGITNRPYKVHKFILENHSGEKPTDCLYYDSQEYYSTFNLQEKTPHNSMNTPRNLAKPLVVGS